MYWYTSSRLHETESCPCRAQRSSAVGANGTGAIRVELVQRVRAEIAAGTYDTPEKFEAAFETLLAQLD